MTEAVPWEGNFQAPAAILVFRLVQRASNGNAVFNPGVSLCILLDRLDEPASGSYGHGNADRAMDILIIQAESNRLADIAPSSAACLRALKAIMPGHIVRIRKDVTGSQGLRQQQPRVYQTRGS